MLYHITNQIPTLKQPEGFKTITLYPHQLTGIEAMLDLEKKSSVKISDKDKIPSILGNANLFNDDINYYVRCGFLADQVGAGKSLMMVGLIMASRLPASFPLNEKKLLIKESQDMVINYTKKHTNVKKNNQYKTLKLNPNDDDEETSDKLDNDFSSGSLQNSKAKNTLEKLLKTNVKTINTNVKTINTNVKTIKKRAKKASLNDSSSESESESESELEFDSEVQSDHTQKQYPIENKVLDVESNNQIMFALNEDCLMETDKKSPLMLFDDNSIYKPFAPSYVVNPNSTLTKPRSLIVKTNLVIIPHNLVKQWTRFFALSNLRVLVLSCITDFRFICRKNKELDKDYMDVVRNIAGSDKKTNTIFSYIDLQKSLQALNDYDVIILNINKYDLFRLIYKDIVWARLIIDEIHSIKIPENFDMYGCFNWYMTATPQYFKNDPPRGELEKYNTYAARLNIYNRNKRYIEPFMGKHLHVIDLTSVKHATDLIKQNKLIPPTFAYIIRCFTENQIKVANTLVPNDVAELINAGNIQEAIRKLGCEVNSDENIIKALTMKYEEDLIKVNAQLRVTENPETKMKDSDREERVKKLKGIIRDLEDKLKTIRDRIKSIDEETCLICASDYDIPTIMVCCKNIFCFKCLMTYFKGLNQNLCPYCRTSAPDKSSYQVIAKGNLSSHIEESVDKNKANEFKKVSKIDAIELLLKTIIAKEKEPRIMIFSNNSESFSKVIDVANKLKISHDMLAGNPNRIQSIIDKYREGKIKLLMLNSQSYGSGLNLEMTTHEILMHRSDDSTEKQIIGRALRFGRTCSLNVYYIINDTESDSNLVTEGINLKCTADFMSKMKFVTNGAVETITTEHAAIAVVEENEDDSEDETSNVEKKSKKSAVTKGNTNNKHTKKTPIIAKSLDEISEDDEDNDDTLLTDASDQPKTNTKKKPTSKPAKKAKAKADSELDTESDEEQNELEVVETIKSRKVKSSGSKSSAKAKK
jgi:hypothetical protein